MHPSSRLADLPELTGVRMVTDDAGEHWDVDPRRYVLHELPPAHLSREWQAHREFAAAGLPGCLHKPPCAISGDGRDLAELYARWPVEREDTYEEAPARGWFQDATPR